MRTRRADTQAAAPEPLAFAGVGYPGDVLAGQIELKLPADQMVLAGCRLPRSFRYRRGGTGTPETVSATGSPAGESPGSAASPDGGWRGSR
jgi:hypothetical protein